MNGLSVLGSMTASLLSPLTTVLPPVAHGLWNHTNHRILGELLQRQLMLHIPKAPPVGIKLFCSANTPKECPKVIITQLLLC